MRIRKQYQVIPTNAKLENGDSTSATNGYTAEYINDHSVVVSPTEPSTDRKKVWLQHSGNILNNTSPKTYSKSTNLTIISTGIRATTTTGSDNDFACIDLGALVDFVGKKIYVKFTSNSSTNLGRIYIGKSNVGQTNRQSIVDSGTLENGTHTLETSTLTNDTDKPRLFIAIYSNSSGNTVTSNTYVDYIDLIVSTEDIPYEPYVEDKEYILNDNDIYEEFEPQNEIYSTSEIRIGTYLGKPLYRKIIDFGALPNNTDKSVALGINNLDLITSMNGVANKPGGNKMPIPTVSSTLSGMIYIYVDASLNLHIVTGEDRSSYTKTYITIEYTKTTD